MSEVCPGYYSCESKMYELGGVRRGYVRDSFLLYTEKMQMYAPVIKLQKLVRT